MTLITAYASPELERDALAASPSTPAAPAADDNGQDAATHDATDDNGQATAASGL